MIFEQFVSFETAKLLKEVRFNCRCRKWYEWKGGKLDEWEADAACNWNTDKDAYSCPTQSLAARWIRSPSNPTLTHGVGFCGGQTVNSSPTPPRQRKRTLKPTSKQWKMLCSTH